MEDLPRLLALVPYLLARPGVRLADVAADFGVTEDQLRKDLNLLWVCGLPGHGPGDLIDIEFEGDTVTLLDPAGVTRPLRLTVDEALSLIVALRALAETPGLGERKALDSALAKVELAAGSAALPAGRVEVALEATAAVLPVVQEALRRGQVLRLAYYVPGRDETTLRDVDPMRVLLVDGRSYLEAWCRHAEGVRLFRLDRIASVELLDLAAAAPEQAEPRDISGGLFRPSPDDLLVTLALRPGAHWVADYYPCEFAREQDDGTIVVGLRTPDLGWVRRLALGLGSQGGVLSPPELLAEVRAEAFRALDGYVS
ncbi:MAG: WYL domain-containing protein [Actinomycetota bacterium]|nr:WYL domain-containing protein [Actinomycetota bacterium]